MPANSKYSQEELYRATATLKRSLKAQILAGKRDTITKKEVLDLLYPKLGLNSPRSLWRGKNKDYIANWYLKLQNELVDLKNTQENNNPIFISNDEIDDNNANFFNLIKSKDVLIRELQNKVKTLQIENENLRSANIGKYGKIDI